MLFFCAFCCLHIFLRVSLSDGGATAQMCARALSFSWSKKKPTTKKLHCVYYNNITYICVCRSSSRHRRALMATTKKVQTFTFNSCIHLLRHAECHDMLIVGLPSARRCAIFAIIPWLFSLNSKLLFLLQIEWPLLMESIHLPGDLFHCIYFNFMSLIIFNKFIPMSSINLALKTHDLVPFNARSENETKRGRK